jgi:hypothetical protein
VEDRVATPVTRPTASKPETESTSNRLLAAGAAEGARKDTGDANVAEMYSGPRTKPIESSSPAKTSSAKNNSKVSPAAAAAAKRLGLGEEVSAKQVADAKAQLGIGGSSAKSSAYPMTSAQPTTKTYDRTGGPTAEELSSYKPTIKNKNLESQIPGNTGKSQTKPVVGEKVEPMSDAERNISNMLAATGVVGGTAGAFYKGKKMLDARKAAQQGAKKRAELKRAAEEGIERNLADEFKDMASSAAKTPAKKPKVAKKNSSYGSAKEDAKADKAYQNLRDSPFTTSTRDKKTLNPLSWMSGPKGMADDFKKGGKVKAKKMASGGAVSGASRRGDGIATRGKTNCKMR